MGSMHRVVGGVLLAFVFILSGLIGSDATAATGAEKTQIVGNGVVFEKNVPIPMSDGSILMANVFRPEAVGNYPVLLSMSIYGKDIHTRDFKPDIWEEMRVLLPRLCETSSCAFHAWEVPDPEVWVPEGYVVIRVDARGSGKSEGKIDPFSPEQIRDFYEAIEWAGTQSWSNGKVGLAGISYYAIMQWAVAAQRPPHLAAIAPWEGANDTYRDVGRHGGILSNVFPTLWEEYQLIPVQNGNADSHFRDMDDGAPIGGPKPLSSDELERKRTNPLELALNNPLDNSLYRERSPRLEDIGVPVLSAGNWGGFGLHSRGNFSGFQRAGSPAKWLSMHTGDHVRPFYSEQGTELLKQFYGFYLKGEDNGWDKRAPVALDIRHADGRIERREENEWPLARTEWRRIYLDAASESLVETLPEGQAKSTYEALENAVVFRIAPLEDEIELTGPMAAKFFVSSSTEDMDLFVTVQAFAPDGTEVMFEGASEPNVPIAQGWLRASHRKLDPVKSRPWQPYHTHDELQPLVPGEVHEVEVEIWPGQIVLPKGYTLALRIEGKDFVRPRAGISGWVRDVIMENILGMNVLAGSGLFLHNHPQDRQKEVFGGANTIHTGGKYPSYLLLPVIP